MKDKPTLADSHIIECLKTDYGLPVTTLTFLPVTTNPDASVYKASTDWASYFVKVKKGQLDLSVVILDLLHKASVESILPPIESLHCKLSERLDDSTLAVYPFIEGENGFNRNLSKPQWIELGKALRRIHEIDMPSRIQEQMRRETFSAKWREAVRALYAHLDKKPVDEVAAKLSAYMQKHIETIRRLVDGAEELSQKVQSHPAKFVLCHSDLHAGNVLLGDNGALYIVDWDDPILAPKERDLMFIGGGVGNVWNQADEKKLFYKGYGKTEVDLTLLSYYRHERIVEDIAVYGKDLLLTKAGGKSRPVMYDHFVEMFAPNGVVDIALS